MPRSPGSPPSCSNANLPVSAPRRFIASPTANGRGPRALRPSSACTGSAATAATSTTSPGRCRTAIGSFVRTWLGRGRSEWLANPAEYAFPTYLSDCAALIARLDVESVDWVGTSMGALIGMFLAARPGTPIRRLVLNDTGAVVSKEGLNRIGGYLGSGETFDISGGDGGVGAPNNAAFGRLDRLPVAQAHRGRRGEASRRPLRLQLRPADRRSAQSRSGRRCGPLGGL